ncbi:hypothetical protein ACFL27_16640 [candidate division CSSED10-310 bacterium]|uniref:Bulb-type lectin domain-containing protein n=1 Tax=candidate division CSSED10-310 bacterium TaxID=2855610 RepID=A0ABV6Z0G2_UNCC1
MKVKINRKCNRFLYIALCSVLWIASSSCTDDNQEKPSTFIKTYGGISIDTGYCVRQTNDEGYIMCGFTFSFNNAGHYDYYLIKTDKYGQEEWFNTFGGDTGDAAYSVQQTHDGGYIMCGFTLFYGIDDSDIFVIKTNDLGEEQWSKTYGSSYFDFGRDILITSDGGYIICGDQQITYTDTDVLLMKIDESGNEQWSQSYGGNLQDTGWSVHQTSDGGYIICGSISSTYYNKDVYLIKTDADGNEQWSRSYGNLNYIEWGKSVIQTSDNGYLIVGYHVDLERAWYGYLIKTDDQGNKVWSKIFQDFTYSVFNSMSETDDLSTIVCGAADSDIRILKIDPQGNILWSKIYGEDDLDSGYSIQQTHDGGFAICGVTGSFWGELRDVLLIKTDRNGVINQDE